MRAANRIANTQNDMLSRYQPAIRVIAAPDPKATNSSARKGLPVVHDKSENGDECQFAIYWRYSVHGILDAVAWAKKILRELQGLRAHDFHLSNFHS
jgi:hypothetical protein